MRFAHDFSFLKFRFSMYEISNKYRSLYKINNKIKADEREKKTITIIYSMLHLSKLDGAVRGFLGKIIRLQSLEKVIAAISNERVRKC